MITACPSGHEYTPENTYVYNGWRMCRECRKLRSRQRAKEMREALKIVRNKKP